MNYNRIYDDALTQEHNAMKMISLLAVIISVMFFLSSILLTEPLFGMELQLLKDIFMITAVVVLIGGILPRILWKKQTLSY